MADPQIIGAARGDAHAFAGEHDDAGGGEGFQETPLPRGRPAIGADGVRGGGKIAGQRRGERRELHGHGKAPAEKDGLTMMLGRFAACRTAE